jgi:hypothetical protein
MAILTMLKKATTNAGTTLLCIFGAFAFSLILSCGSSKGGAEESSADSSKSKKSTTVLILGNSITKHGPSPAIGWHSDWGMAATAIDSDFVHILTRTIRQKDNAATITIKNISDFERNFTTYPLTTLDSLKNPDILIMRISENVPVKKALDSNFILYYDRLINYLDPGRQSEKIIVDGFWDNPGVNDSLKKYAVDNRYPFVTITDLSKDSTNQAWGKFKNPGVASHPSNKGMQLIAQRIWEAIRQYF